MTRWAVPRTRARLRGRPAPALPPYRCQCRYYSTGGDKSKFATIFERLRAAQEEDGKQGLFKQDAERKKVVTAAGELPMSPVMDPDWHESRERFTKTKASPKKPVGRFRKLLASNIFAQSLATPVRLCAKNKSRVPQAMLQAFTLVQNPKTGVPWWTPKELAQHDYDETSSSQSPSQQVNPKEPVVKKRATTDTVYMVAHRSAIGKPKDLEQVALFAKGLWSANQNVHRMLAMSKNGRPIWRLGMDEVVLDMMREKLVEDMLWLARRSGQIRGRTLITPMESFDDVEKVAKKGCVLWLPEREEKKVLESEERVEGGEGEYGDGKKDSVIPELAKGMERDAAEGDHGGEKKDFAKPEPDKRKEIWGGEGHQKKDASNLESAKGKKGKEEAGSREGPIQAQARRTAQMLKAWRAQQEKQEAMAKPLPPGAPGFYATFDVPDAPYNRKVPVHNLELLLGPEHLKRLVEGDSVYGENHLLMVAYSTSKEVQSQLWKLQGFLA